MPNRIIKESICTSDTIDALSVEAEAFFYRLMVQCDDFGRMDARLSVVRARCFPLRLGTITDGDVSAWMAELKQANLLWIYAVDDRPYIQITTWDKHQQKRAQHSKYPEPPAPDINGNQWISTDSNSPREARSENTRSEKREYEEGASAAAQKLQPKKQAITKPEKPAAVLAYQDAAGALPAKTLWDSMDEAIGSKPDDLKFWGTVVRAWIAKGWNPRNLSGMFDFFKRHEIPAGNGSSGSSPPRKQTEAEDAYRRANTPAAIEKLKADLAASKGAQHANTG